MFGRRSDGKKVKGLGIMDRAVPFFMPTRQDSCNLIRKQVACFPIDEFIKEQRKQGEKYTYTHIVIASLVRLLYLRPKLNRFIMHNEIYQRNSIQVSMDIKRTLEDDGEDLSVKFYFTGRESIFEIREIINSAIDKAMNGSSATTEKASIFCKLPSWLFRFAMWIVRIMDNHGILPKSAINASPFHASLFLTNLKSIKTPAIYHHLYNFGNCTLFVSMGKEDLKPKIIDKEVVSVKEMELGVTMDERVADGFYYGKSLRLWSQLLENPNMLIERMPDGEIPKRLKKPKKIKKDKAIKNKSNGKKEKAKKVKPIKAKEEKLNIDKPVKIKKEKIRKNKI